MKRIAWKLLIAALVGWMVASGVYSFYDSGGPEYYSSHPGRLLYVLAITLAVAAIVVPTVLLLSRLSPRAQRGVKLLALGSAAVLFSLVLGWVLVGIARLLWAVGFDGGLALAAGLLFGVAALTGLVALLWYDFFRLLKTGRSRLL